MITCCIHEINNNIFCIFLLTQAIWYTETAGIEGPAFGNTNTWKGLGVFCDSFDNDQQVSDKVNLCDSYMKDTYVHEVI